MKYLFMLAIGLVISSTANAGAKADFEAARLNAGLTTSNYQYNQYALDLRKLIEYRTQFKGAVLNGLKFEGPFEQLGGIEGYLVHTNYYGSNDKIACEIFVTARPYFEWASCFLK